MVKEFTQLYERHKKIDNFITFSTPNRDDYKIDKSKLAENGKFINVYDNSELVQIFGGIDFGFGGKFGLAKRIDVNATKNILVETPNKALLPPNTIVNILSNEVINATIEDHGTNNKETWRQIENEIK